VEERFIACYTWHHSITSSRISSSSSSSSGRLTSDVSNINCNDLSILRLVSWCGGWLVARYWCLASGQSTLLVPVISRLSSWQTATRHAPVSDALRTTWKIYEAASNDVRAATRPMSRRRSNLKQHHHWFICWLLHPRFRWHLPCWLGHTVQTPPSNGAPDAYTALNSVIFSCVILMFQCT